MECGRWLDTPDPVAILDLPPPQVNPERSVPILPPPMTGPDEQARIQAEGQRFTTKAFITFLLYLLLWVPGVIANYHFWKQANKVENLTGVAPPGKGCLTAMLVITVILFVLGMFLLLSILATY